MCSIVSSSELQISPEISKNAELHLHLLNHFGHWLCCLRNRSPLIAWNKLLRIFGLENAHAQTIFKLRASGISGLLDPSLTSLGWTFSSYNSKAFKHILKYVEVSWSGDRGVITVTSSVPFCLYPGLQLLLTLSFCYGAHCLERTCGASLNWNRTEGKVLPNIELQNAKHVKITWNTPHKVFATWNQSCELPASSRSRELACKSWKW